MTTVLWVGLCVLGLLTGFAVGWSRRHRSADPVVTRATPAPPAREVDDAPAHEAPVIDLRVVPTAPESRATPSPDDEAESPVVEEAAPSPPERRLSLATTGGAAVAHRGEDRPDAEVIDLAAASRPVPLHNLQFIDGIGPRLDKRLRANGIVTVTDLATAGRKRLRRVLSAQLPGGDDAVDRLLERARSMVETAERGRVAPVDPGTELRRVQGIGTTMMRWLETEGITTLAQLAELTKADLAELDAALADYPGRIRAEKWRGQARRLRA